MSIISDLHSSLGDYCYYPVVLNSILSYLLDKHPLQISYKFMAMFTFHLKDLKRSLRKF